MFKNIIYGIINLILILITACFFLIEVANSKEPEFCVITENGEQYLDICGSASNEKIIIKNR